MKTLNCNFPSARTWKGGLVSRKRQAPIEPPDLPDLALETRVDALLKRRPLCRHNGARVLRERVAPPATFTSCIDEKKFYVPTGKFRTAKRTGKVTEEKIPMTLQTATVTISVPTLNSQLSTFQFTATNRGMLVRDSRDNSRKPISEVRAELQRLTASDAAAADLLAVIQTEPRKPKPDTRVFSAPEPIVRQLRTRVPKPAPEPEPDLAAMTAKQFAAHNRKLAAQAAEAMNLSITAVERLAR